MTQTFLCILTSFLMLIAPIFNITLTEVTMPQGLACEDEPTADVSRTYDRVDGVNNSVFYIARPNEKNYTTVSTADFGLNEAAEDNYDAFCKAIEYCKANPNTRLTVDGGKYHFRTDRTIPIDGLKNTLIDADGAQFVFEHPNYFSIVNCDCIEIRGLSITWNFESSRLGSIVRVKNANKKKHTVEFEFTELDEVSADIPIMAFTKYDPETLTPGTKDFKENYVYQYPEVIKSVEKTDHNVLKITHDGALDNYKNGEVYLLRHHVYDGNAFNVHNTSNITFSDVKLYAVAGMGWLIESRSERFQLIDCVIGLDPEHERDNRISATADGVHIANTNGKFRITGCDFSFMGDDDVNVHDNVAMVTDRLDDRSVEIYTNANNFAVGDTAVFNSEYYEKLGFGATIISIDGNKLRFDRDIPESVTKDCIVSNGSLDSGNYVISNNYFHENRARGLLLQSSNGLCESNRFYKTMANPIKIIMDISSGAWLEGTGVNGLVVRNNSFSECNVAEWGAQIIISTNIDGKSAKVPMFFNVSIESNSFENFSGKLVEAANASNLSICDNKISNRHGSVDIDRGQIKIDKTCSKVTVSGNEYAASIKAPFQNLVRFKSIKSAI